jgi:hypothetical protein
VKVVLAVLWFIAPGMVAQAAGGDPWGFLANYGAAAPFAALCLWIINRKDKEIETLRAEVASVTKVGMEQVVPALVRSTDGHAEAVKALEAATSMMHRLAGRGLDAEVVNRLYRVLRDVEQKLNGTTSGD